MSERVVVVGADAAGMSAASQAKRLRGDDLEVVALERSRHASYSACGIPYWVGGEVGSVDDLIARTPAEHRANGIDLRMRTEAMAIDVDRREVEVRDHAESTTYRLGFDHLVIATGASPGVPDVTGVDADGIHGVQTLDDGERLLDELGERAAHGGRGRRRLHRHRDGRGDGAPRARRHGGRPGRQSRWRRSTRTWAAWSTRRWTSMGIDVRTKVELRGFETDDAGHVRGVVTGDGTIDTDLVVLGTGVAPETALARDAGLSLGRWGGLVTDLQMRVFDAEGVWAAGDCVESIDLVSGNRVHVALGTHANKQGRVLGTNLGGGYATFPGVVGTAVSKVCDLEIARTGLREADCDAVGFRWLTVTVESTTRAGYYPDAAPITVKLVVERRTGRLLGGQIVGREGAAKRIDTLAVALWNHMTVEEVAMLDLGYAPPFSPVWDPVLIAARQAADAVRAG